METAAAPRPRLVGLLASVSRGELNHSGNVEVLTYLGMLRDDSNYSEKVRIVIILMVQFAQMIVQASRFFVNGISLCSMTKARKWQNVQTRGKEGGTY